MKKWEIQSEIKIKNHELRIRDLIELLLANRGLTEKKDIDDYLNPKIEILTTESLGIDKKDLGRGLIRIKRAINNQEQIIVFGDYDVDGIAGSAILWESLNNLGANVMPYIPHRVDEGYGLSIKGLDQVLKKYPEVKLIITVDNGIVANEAVDYANSLGLEVIITDHHAPGESLPKAFAIIHSTKICGAAVGWILARQLNDKKENDHLGLVALATVTDVMPLSGFNRVLVKIGLDYLRKSERPGLIELLTLAGVDREKIGVYELGHVIGPRLNAMGRIEHAMDSLRFLCTPNFDRARELANALHITNRERQQLTLDGVNFAKKLLKEKKTKLIFISDDSLAPGIIGLVSGRLTEEFYRPSIVISKAEELSKGSARSVAGFNIIEFIRKFSHFLIDKGGHPMAAGFTVGSKDIEKLREIMTEAAEKEIDEKLLVRKLKIDCELPIEYINLELFDQISKFSPFGFGNPEPTFLSKNLIVEDMRLVGADAKHLKLKLRNHNSELRIDGILFGYDRSANLKIGNKIDVVYNISLNEWKGNKKLELRIKDFDYTGSE